MSMDEFAIDQAFQAVSMAHAVHAMINRLIAPILAAHNIPDYRTAMLLERLDRPEPVTIDWLTMDLGISHHELMQLVMDTRGMLHVVTMGNTTALTLSELGATKVANLKREIAETLNAAIGPEPQSLPLAMQLRRHFVAEHERALKA